MFTKFCEIILIDKEYEKGHKSGGKKRYHKCMRYEESDEYKEAKKMFLGKLR